MTTQRSVKCDLICLQNILSLSPVPHWGGRPPLPPLGELDREERQRETFLKVFIKRNVTELGGDLDH